MPTITPNSTPSMMPAANPTIVVTMVCRICGHKAGICTISVRKICVGRGSTMGLTWNEMQPSSQTAKIPTINAVGSK